MASAYLSRTPSSTGNDKIATFSAWVKRCGNLGSQNNLFTSFPANERTQLFFTPDATLKLQAYVSGSATTNLETSMKFRDVNGWYHIVVAMDSTQATNTNRVKIYVNGVQQTISGTYLNQNTTLSFNTSGRPFYIGTYDTSQLFFDGEMAHVHWIDGTIYAPSTLDSSGNSNNWTTSGTIIQNKDTPSNVFCTMNPLMINPSATNTFANTNNTVTINATDACVGATLGASSGKYYWEQKWTQQGANDRWGVCPDDASMSNHPRTTGIGWDTATSQFYLLGNAVSGSWGGSIGTSEIIQIALDLDNSALYLGVNGTYRNSGNPTSGSSRTGAVNFSSSSLVGKYLLPAFGKGNQDNSTMQYNFGNGYFGTTAVSSAQNPDDGIGIFEYDPPAGYRALCTKSINAEEYS